ncbi:MAG TPA: CAP domain-containing protein [Bacteriovoracaceae bacterium]|nr:CAP domain-containing protein [Bacteriovoracaceae bacterium]
MALPKKNKLPYLLLSLLLTTACGKSESSHPEFSISETISETPAEKTAPTVKTTPTFTEQFMDLVNNHRQSLGLRDLINDDDISQIAQTHSDNMASGKISFGHSGFSSRCSSAKAAIGGGNLCAENVAKGQSTPAGVFNSWMNSPDHKANIEQSRFSHSGIAFKKSASGTYYWTHIFIEEN